MNVYVAKFGRQTEPSEKFDPLKLHRSVVAACSAVRAFEGEAHLTAQHVCEQVLEWLETKTEVTSADIRRVAGKSLQVYHPEAAYVYEHYKGMI